MRSKQHSNQPEELPAVYKPAEVAHLLRCDVRTIHGMIERGELPAIRTGRVLKIPRKAVDTLLEGKTPESRAAGD